jgi:lipopolysaccharide export system permease protein
LFRANVRSRSNNVGKSLGHPGIPRLYATNLTRRVLGQLLLLLFLIEAIFLAEHLNTILESAFRTQATFGDISRLLVYAAPEVFDLALPTAILIAMYRVALRAREDRELLVLSGLGIGSLQILSLGVAVAVFAQAASLLTSGVLEPLAKFGHRKTLFEAEYRALSGGATNGQFYNFGSYTVFAGPKPLSVSEHRLFIHHLGADIDRVITARRAWLTTLDSEGHVALTLRDFVTLDFEKEPPGTYKEGWRTPAAGAARCEDCEQTASVNPSARTQVRNYEQQLTMNQLLSFEPRGSSLRELTLFELLSAEASKHAASDRTREIGRRVARSLLCLVAPAIAALGLAFTNNRTYTVALPVACACLIAIDLSATLMARALAPWGLSLLLAVVLACYGATFWLLRRAVALREAELLRPTLAP